MAGLRVYLPEAIVGSVTGDVSMLMTLRLLFNPDPKVVYLDFLILFSSGDLLCLG